jgi:sphinganine-1-phosphate aldolase
MEKAGFPLPERVDFREPGVTSISCDPHKYGFAPKGASVVLFRSLELRHHMYTFVTDFTGGLYATPTLLGSRPGGVVAATWASMVLHGERGYVESCKLIVGACRRLVEAVENIPELEIVGRPDVSVFAFTTKESCGIGPYDLCDYIKEHYEWELGTCQNPPALHLALTQPTSRNVEQFVDDLKSTLAEMKQGAQEGKFKGGTAGIYGMAASLPSSFVEDAMKVYLDTCVKTGSATTEAAAKPNATPGTDRGGGGGRRRAAASPARRRKR